MPGLSMSADRAARQIVAATARGDAEKILSTPANILARFHGLFRRYRGHPRRRGPADSPRGGPSGARRGQGDQIAAESYDDGCDSAWQDRGPAIFASLKS